MKYCSLLLFFLCVSLSTACQRQADDRPNILMIVVDTLRADRLGAYGNARGLTPFLDALAARGTVFENTYAPSSWTVPSIASLFTSRYASQHGTTTLESRLASQEVTLAERLGHAGYATGGLSANFRLSRHHGFAQGFQHWRAYVPPRAKMPLVRGDRLRLDALAWFRRARDEMRGRPMFLYLQYMEPHSPYDPPEPYRGRFANVPSQGADEANEKLSRLLFKELSDEDVTLLQSLYDGEVAAVDEEIRLLFERLERSGFLRNTVVVLTADHGEEFGEHQVFAHGHSLFQDVIRVPLIIVAPGVPGGGTVSRNVSLVDVAPTVLELAGLPPEPRFEGTSVVALMKTAAGRDRPDDAPAGEVLSELPVSGSTLDLRRHEQALLKESDKVLMTPYGFAVTFDLAVDAGENDPTAAEKSAEGEALERALVERLANLQKRASPMREAVEVDEATREKLRALGYHD